jgi:arabinan endo-1,5-alpha-L-arabinosidase
MRLPPPDEVCFSFAAQVGRDALRIESPDGAVRDYPLGDRSPTAWLDLQETLAADFGFRPPAARRRFEPQASGPAYRPILTEPLSPEILYGYGDPAVLRVAADDYVLLVTSNDAPDAFPILRSSDLETWRLAGFVFPEGRAPAWALVGENRADFWAPEMHRIGEEFWVVFTARRHDRSLAVGLAKSSSPEGPFQAAEAPLVSGGVIDPHILLGPRGAPYLVWKEDRNDVWPGLLARLLRTRPQLIPLLFPDERDQRCACLTASLAPWIEGLEPMERFFALQPLIEAVAEDFAGVAVELATHKGTGEILEALRTRIWAQRLAADGNGLEGPRTLLLQNDQAWEAHLIEGVWATQQDGRCWLFYAGNDFATPNYGVGAAVADHPLGPYRKVPAPLLTSTAQWWGPGHPSVATGPDGRPHLFLHAFRPGQAGYKAFRALLSAPLTFAGDTVRVG